MVSDEIIKVLDNLGEKFGIFIDWSNENITPYLLDLIQRIKTFNIVNSIYSIFIGCIFFGIIIFSLKMIKKYIDSDFEEGVICIGCVLICIFLVLAPIFFFGGISDLIESIYLPEKAILEMIKRSLRR